MKLQHACSLGDVEVPSLSDEAALALAVHAYRHWRSTAMERGWLERLQAVQVWIHADGSYQDSLYVASDEALVVLETWHDHAGEDCSEGHTRIIAHIPMETVHAAAGPAGGAPGPAAAGGGA